MSPQNLEVVREAIDAFNRRDLDGVIRDNHPDVVVDWSRSLGVEAGIYHGVEAVRAFWQTFLETFDRVAVSPDEFIESGEHVVVPNRSVFWGRGGIKVEAEGVLLHTLRDSRIVELRLYRHRAEALEAVGLEE